MADGWHDLGEIRSEVAFRRYFGPFGLWRIRLYVPGTENRWTVWQFKFGRWTFGYSPARPK